MTEPTPKAQRQPTVSAKTGTASPDNKDAAGIADCFKLTASPSLGRRADEIARFTAVWFAAFIKPAITRHARTAMNDRADVASVSCATALITSAPVICRRAPILWARRPAGADATVAAKKNEPSPHP